MTTIPAPVSAGQTAIDLTVEADPAKAADDALADRVAAGLPAGFLWGAATSAYQIEGAFDVDGRAASIWDTFSRTPGKTYRGESGDVAVDHYHRYRDDVALMASLGLGAYRFSVAWPRIQPQGRGPANAAGVDFYSRLVDTLLEAGIEPWMTLYHWDLPQALQDHGGWADRDTSYRFADYAAIMADALADRVRNVSTLNEPWCSAFEGNMSGRHAPGVQDAATASRVVHHLLLGHGLAAVALRSHVVPGIGTTLNLLPVYPTGGSPAELDAARRFDGQQNRLWLDPLLRGAYPADVVADLEAAGAPLPVEPGDLAVISAPLDWLGVNYYSPHVVRPEPDPDPAAPPSPFVGAGEITRVKLTEDVTALGWPVRPWCFTEMLRRLARDYPGVPLYVHENGAAYPDEVRPDGTVVDPLRRRYLASHLDAARDAVASGVDLRGYFVWSFMDNFEWAEGYRMRFGVVHVDFASQRRSLKASAHWYSRLIRAHGERSAADPSSLDSAAGLDAVAGLDAGAGQAL